MQRANNNYFLKITAAVIGICLILPSNGLANKQQEITSDMQELSDDINLPSELIHEVIEDENIGMALVSLKEGDKLFLQKSYKNALVKYEYAETLTPDNPEIYYKKATVFKKLNRIKDADEALKLAKDKEIGMALVSLKEGDKLFLQKSYKNALAKYEYAETLTPDNPEIYYKKATVLRKLNRIKDADEAIRIANEKEESSQ